MSVHLLKIRKKFLKFFAKYVPGNSLRVGALRLCHYAIGKDVYIGEDAIIIDDLEDPSACLVIGDRVSIAPRVTFVLHSAPNESRIRPYVKEIKGSITVHQDAWLGTGAIILPNVVIGEGAIVGSNSLVTRDVPEYTIVGGSPARPIKTFDVPWRKHVS